MMEEDDSQGDAGTMRGIGGPVRNKKGASTALIDAVSILATAKTQDKERKFNFLSEHLQQQGELRRRELDIERKWLDLEREKTAMEQEKTNLMMRQLEESIRVGISHGKGSKSRKKNIIIDDEEEESNSIFDLENV
ncbi:hypothetical protein B9Z19DRAFT_1068063 [Tuber borchii]|uniref:No apical meristem-associated C-terminal domain-containing protein n=1 Tax=Tuber borchii TaxID=42251 RepID=A0A2T6ZGM5_TUBBO|nr:hypothetical protein B9Z19DRAFT_1068063 [Tuber borchii]